VANGTGAGPVEEPEGLLTEAEHKRLVAVQALHPLVAATLDAYARQLGDDQEVLYHDGADGLFRFVVHELESVLTGQDLTDDALVAHEIERALTRAKDDLDATLDAVRGGGPGCKGSAA